MHQHKTKAIAERAFDTFKSLYPLQNYMGILALQGEARLCLATGDEDRLGRLCDDLAPFISPSAPFPCNFIIYHCGGNGTAILLKAGKLEAARETVERHAGLLMETAPRGENRLFCHPKDPEEGWIFIDVAFAVSPFLIHAGLALGNEAMVNEGVHQTLGLYEILLDSECGLVHQGKNVRGNKRISDDHWSRGNGWGLLALAEMLDALPPGHRHRDRVAGVLQGHLQAALQFQDDSGMWHQEMTRPDSYPETSGTALILYALGTAIRHGVTEDRAGRLAFQRGISGLLGYIALDGSIHNTCRGCLCPGDGTIADYMEREAKYNDPHAFGAVSLAFGQAWQLGWEEVGKHESVSSRATIGFS